MALEEGRHGETIQLIGSYLETEASPYVSAYVLRGAAYMTQRRPELAASDFLKALELDPQNVPAHINLGRIRLQQGRLDEAGEYFQNVLATEPSDAAAQHLLGVVYQQQRKLRQAQQAFEAALTLRPGYAPTSARLGAVLAQLGSYEKAGGPTSKPCVPEAKAPR